MKRDLVVGNLSKKPGEATIQLDLQDFFDWNRSEFRGMPRVQKKGELLQVIEHIGYRDARLLDVQPHSIRVHVRGHGMALVEAAGHQLVR